MTALLLLATWLLASVRTGSPTRDRDRQIRRRRRRNEVRLPRPRPYQQPILNDRARRKVIAAGRRWGKSTTALTMVLAGHGPLRKGGVPLHRGALHGANVWWVVPNMRKTGRARWRDLKRAVGHAYTRKNETEFRIDLPGGGSIEIRSAEDVDALRGEGLDGVVIDEAASMAEEAWTEALRAALSDRRGWCVFMGTPKGRANWFFRMYVRGVDEATAAKLHLDADPRRPGWASWQRPSSDNPQLTADELDDARLDLGSLLFAQEYEASFVVVAGGVISRSYFRYYDPAGEDGFAIEADTPRVVARRELTVFATVDPAVSTKTTADYTVIAIIGMTRHRELVLLDLIRARLEGPDLVPLLRAVQLKWRPTGIYVEATAYQLSIVQEGRRRGVNVRKLTADRDKVSRALFLAGALEAARFFFPRTAPWLGELETELEAFPEGDHDDQVDVLAYAAQEAAEGVMRTMVQH